MPYSRVTIAPRYALRLEDLEATDAVFARCDSCGREWLIATHRLHNRFRAYARMKEIGQLMRCPTCKTGAAVSWYVLRASPPM